MSRAVLLAAAALWLTHASAAHAQVRVEDLVITLGGSVEGYTGNFSDVTSPLVDSTDHATAVVGELGVRSVVSFSGGEGRSLVLSADGGMRQAAAMGFTIRDYAPREWAGAGRLRFEQSLGSWARLIARVGARTRTVRDRTPPPLFLQPGYATVEGGLGLVTRSFQGVSLDLQVDAEEADYKTLRFAPQLDLLDRSTVGFVAGARWGSVSTLRFFGGVRWTEYPHQGSFVADDPFRQDRTVDVGLEWTHFGDRVFLQTALEGTINRSNSNRPEYDALSFDALLNVPMPWRTSLNLRVVLTGKSYVTETDVARLVPGEEADNASIAYLQLTRPINERLDGAVRFGWTRAETDLANAYFRRFGGSIQLNYRPRF